MKYHMISDLWHEYEDVIHTYRGMVAFIASHRIKPHPLSTGRVRINYFMTPHQYGLASKILQSRRKENQKIELIEAKAKAGLY